MAIPVNQELGRKLLPLLLLLLHLGMVVLALEAVVVIHQVVVRGHILSPILKGCSPPVLHILSNGRANRWPNIQPNPMKGTSVRTAAVKDGIQEPVPAIPCGLNIQVGMRTMTGFLLRGNRRAGSSVWPSVRRSVRDVERSLVPLGAGITSAMTLPHLLVEGGAVHRVMTGDGGPVLPHAITVVVVMRGLVPGVVLGIMTAPPLLLILHVVRRRLSMGSLPVRIRKARAVAAVVRETTRDHLSLWRA